MVSKVYLQPLSYVLGTIQDIKEMQRGEGTFSDTANGIIYFTAEMYNSKWEYRFNVEDIGRNRCKVKIEIGGDERDKEEVALRMFAFLDSMLLANANIELLRGEGVRGE